MVTSNIVFVPQSFASESIVLEESSESEVTDEVQEPELIINAWDENGFYHDADGVIVKDKILSVDGKMYLFDKNGIAVLYTGNLKSSDGKTATIVETFTITNASGKSIVLKPTTIFKNKNLNGGGYLGYWNATGSDYYKAGSFTILPYWVTPDTIKVNGISTRTITISSMTKSGISKEDE